MCSAASPRPSARELRRSYMDGESEGDSSEEIEEGQKAIESQDDTDASEPSAL